ncbi:MAG TPA: TIGR03013 family XrtA/PEP-CTERM system glycosyltransferase [Steroidobacteraceae bacterium]|jgi:sugar transferase (PEP-CTERM system associated)|nr:TIGR03013 family XrtA/PEP-CTERM system glycosyltransferase [Steroidobacteraceae bacterium]
MELVIFGAALGLAVRLVEFIDNAVPTAESIGGSLPVGLLFITIMCVAMAAMGLYNVRQVLRPAGLLVRISVAAVGGTVLVGLISRLVPSLYIAGEALFIGASLVIAGSFAWHTVLDRIARENARKRRVVVYGAGRRAASLLQLSERRDQRGLNIVGYILAVGDDVEASALRADQRIELRTSLHEYCRANDISEIVVAMDDSRWGIPFNAFLECRLAGVTVTELTAFLERETGKVCVDLAHPSWTMYASGFRRNSWQSRLERVIDIAASLLLLAATWPVMLLTVLAIKLEDGLAAPVLYRQVRVGERGHPFQLLKFRSMREDAERDGARWAAANDTRVTRVGRVIRKLRIDELPQILNVLAGQMSLVGPRPERPEFVSHLDRTIPFYCERHTIKPGITGWAQLCYPYGANETDAAEKLQYDLFYVKNRTLLFYFAILLQTVEVVLCGKGAR